MAACLPLRVRTPLSGMGRRRRTLPLSAASYHPPAPRPSTPGQHDAKRERDLCISSTQTVLLDDLCATTYKQFGKICIYHIGYVAVTTRDRCSTRFPYIS